AVDLGFGDAMHGMPTTWTTAVPGRPGGVGIPASNVALPGGIPAPGPAIPTSPSMPFGQAIEAMANTLVAGGPTPPFGGAGVQKPPRTAHAVPDVEALAAPIWDTPPNLGLVDHSAAALSDSTMPSPNQQPVPNNTAAAPDAGPFGATSFDNWNGFGS